MTKILFVCLGNICRSPMAEMILRDMVRRRGLEAEFVIASAATSTEEIGNPVYPPARRMLASHGIDCGGKRAVQLCRADYDRYDCFVGMDMDNVRRMRHIFGGDDQGKISLLLHYTDRPGDVEDPWYTLRFDHVFDEITRGCQALLAELLREE